MQAHDLQVLVDALREQCNSKDAASAQAAIEHNQALERLVSDTALLCTYLSNL